MFKDLVIKIRIKAIRSAVSLAKFYEAIGKL